MIKSIIQQQQEAVKKFRVQSSKFGNNLSTSEGLDRVRAKKAAAVTSSSNQ